MKKKIIGISIIVTSLLIALISTVFLFQGKDEIKPHKYVNRSYNQAFDSINDVPLDSTYISYSYFRDNILKANSTYQQVVNAINGKKIRIDNAEELFRFSMDVSYNQEHVYITPNPTENVKLSKQMIDLILSLNYVLGDNIDYSVNKAKQFVPIGYDFYSLNSTHNKGVFTGTFDGQGFEIRNLTLAGYEYVTTSEGSKEAAVDIAVSPYYSMFNYNEGTIKNLGLINPSYEWIDDHEDISRTSNLVGLNSGNVENVYVIDNRTDINKVGIRFKVPSGSTSTRYYASGVVFENAGTFKNSYYVSKVVVNIASINNFNVQPLLHDNRGTISNLLYDANVYLTKDTSIYNVTPVNLNNAIGVTTSSLKSGTNLNNGKWYAYEQDSYPVLYGLAFVDGKYQISKPIDLIYFSYILSLNTVKNGISFRNASYQISSDLNMNIVASTAYKTPSIEFNGTLSGLNAQGKNSYISNLNIVNGVNLNGIYYSGLFSVIKGSVKNITLSNLTMTLKNSNAYYSSTFKIGSIAGSLEGGRIENVLSNVNIDLGTQAIGSLQLGGLVGSAYGTIEKVLITGTINSNNHTFSNDQIIIPTYNIGGIIGLASGDGKLTVYNLMNQANIIGIGSTNNSTTNETNALIYIGGVIGSITNTSSIRHDFRLISNEGTITVKSFLANKGVLQYVGGIFGLSLGNKYTLNSEFGRFENRGNIIANDISSTNMVRAAGIGVSKHSEQVEFVHLNNYGNYQTNNINNFKYTATIYDVSATGVILSQVTNYSSFTYSTSGINNVSPLYFSENNAYSLLRYVENNGDVTFNVPSVTTTTYISGITTSTNIDYLNVYFYGEIKVYSFTISQPLYIAGISNTLTNGRYLKNSLNHGNIIVSNINTGNNATSKQNIYVAGLININLSGDLNTQDNSNQPKATKGIINSLNYGNITSTLNSSTYGITGYGNFYAGGIVTLNQGSIQDSANLGDIKIANISPLASTVVTTSSDSYLAGLITGFSGGVTTGGIVSVVTHGDSRIYDCVNSGEIIAFSQNYARSGGVLGVTLQSELLAGKVDGVPQTDLQIENSILSNGVNYGTICAITSTTFSYSTSNTNQSIGTALERDSNGSSSSVPTRTGSNERPQIYSSAGGIIAYGLSVMRRMLNHGTICSTDVAGGIVGATYVLGAAIYPVTIVNIDTAINYGSIRAVKTSGFANIKNDISYNNIKNYLYAVNDNFIFPTSPRYDVRRLPEGKRGIGGIFGRLQRGVRGIMTSYGGNFNFIVNVDPNVDLVGRVDQDYDFTRSARYFQFGNAVYYTARQNDTTQVVFTGYEYYTNRVYSEALLKNVTRINTNITRATTDDNNDIGKDYTFTITKTYYFSTQSQKTSKTYLTKNYKIGLEFIAEPQGAPTSTTTSNITTSHQTIEIVYSKDPNAYVTGTTNNNVTYPELLVTSYTVNTAYPSPALGSNIDIKKISETSGVANTEYMYDPNFKMRDPNVKLSNGESITSYIYYVENGVLSDRFRSSRPNGMYVLSSSSGSSFGAVIPANMDLTKVYKLNGSISYDTDYDSVPLNLKTPLEVDVMNGYANLLQTKFNDKSALLDTNQTIKLEEIGGSKTLLSSPTIDNVNKTITYTISLEAFLASQNQTSYKVTTPLIPANALIAARIEDYQNGAYLTNVQGFINLLYQERNNGVAENLAPTLNINLSSYRNITTQSSPILIGKFTSYSEASYNVASFMNNSYTTQYSVYIILKPTIANTGTGTLGLTNVNLNGSGTTKAYSPDDIVTSTIKFNFTDTKGILGANYDIKPFVSLYYNNELVDPQYYTLVSTVKTGTTFSFTIGVTTDIRGGNSTRYEVRYKYFESSAVNYLYFYKGASTSNAIISLSHYSQNPYTVLGTTFTTNVDFGYSFPTSANFAPIINSSTKSYLNNTTYSISSLDSFTISPFATLQSVNYIGLTYVNGYYNYQYQYVIRSESGANATYTHNIRERTIDVKNVFKDGNRVNLNNIFATREAQLSSFIVDFEIEADLYKLIADNPNSYFTINLSTSVGDIKGIKYLASSSLSIQMDYSTLPSSYTFSFTYTRGSQVINIATPITIIKKQGVDAYLKDITFSDTEQDASYAKIREAGADGMVVTPSSYDLRVYYEGIDYDGSDLKGLTNYRIFGQVANTPLNDYSPVLLPYLPYGANISRKAYNSTTKQWYWTSEVKTDSPEAVKLLLNTDFTVFPDTGLEPDENSDVIITYRITSEDGLKQIYYHITVNDIVYNVSVIFNVYYVQNDVPVLAENSSELRLKTLLFNIKNFNTDLPTGLSPITNVPSFPAFSQITGYNNNTYQFYVPYNTQLQYRFGRNISGFFLFDLTLPKDNLNRPLYDYYITFNGQTLNNVSNYVSGVNGKYFYINSATKNRTRVFNVYISKLSQIPNNNNWGFVDYVNTFN